MLAALSLTALLPSGMALPVKILPIGDSITAGALAGPNSGDFGRGGYRYYFERFVEASDGLPNFEIIGSSPEPGGTMVSYAGQWFDNDKPMKFTAHNGYPGFLIAQITALVEDGTIPVDESDVILLQIGTNNVGYGSSIPASPAEISSWRSDYEDLLDAVLAQSSLTQVVMAKIPPVAEGTPYWDDGELIVPGSLAANSARILPFNEQVVQVVHADYSAAHPGRFVLIDNFSGPDPLNFSDDVTFSTSTNSHDYFTGLGDGIHPYNGGHRKLAVHFWNGYQRARGKARTAIVTPLDDTDGDGVAGGDVCILGNGTRRQGRGTDVEDQPYVLASISPGKRAKFYMKLDLSGLPKQWDEARFNLIFWGAPTANPTFGNCCDDQPSTAMLEVYGIADGMDDWTEDDLTWAGAPGNDPDGNGVLGTLLGQITVPSGLQTGEVVSFSSSALRDFVNLGRGADGLLTFAVVGSDLDPGYRVSFQDSDLRDYAPAFLQLADATIESGPSGFRVLGADFDLDASPQPEVQLRFTSSEGETYLVGASEDMQTFDEVLASGIAASAGGGETTVTVPLPPGREQIFLRVERQ